VGLEVQAVLMKEKPTIAQMLAHLHRLDDRARRVLVMREGLDEEYPYPNDLASTAKVVGMTKDRTLRVWQDAIERIRQLVEAEA
jgi:DNA-directed RNA polymerase sigma subunit (sigma70/sigma32)